jgi:DNA polymerase
MWRDCRNGNGIYGGLLTENIVQAIARDLLVAAMRRITAANFPITLHIHDEIVAEVAADRADTEQFTRLMITPPNWASGFPIAAEAWTGSRFCK